MTRNVRQISADRPTLTRAQVAKRLGRNVSWVRRREGKELHPVFVDGVHRFDPLRVVALQQRLEAERSNAERSEAMIACVYRAFEAHSRGATPVSVDDIVETTGLEPRIIRALHAKWSTEDRKAGGTIPALLTREQFRAEEQREVDAVNREYDERMAQWQREDEERRKAAEAQRKRQDKERARADKALEERRARRRVENGVRIAALRPAPVDANVLEVLASQAGSKLVDEVTTALLDLVRRR